MHFRPGIYFACKLCGALLYLCTYVGTLLSHSFLERGEARNIKALGAAKAGCTTEGMHCSCGGNVLNLQREGLQLAALQSTAFLWDFSSVQGRPHSRKPSLTPIGLPSDVHGC